MPIEFAFLADRVDAMPVVAGWYRDEWGDLLQGGETDVAPDQLEAYLNRDEIPFLLIATKGDELVGAAQLKRHELIAQFPDRMNWMGGVYVVAEHRGRGYGSLIAERIATMAPEYGVQTLHLQTPALDGGLYARLGWSPVTRATNHGLDVLVMERRLTVPEVRRN
jgi:GNAT superfamily N-acetyltransferase